MSIYRPPDQKLDYFLSPILDYGCAFDHYLQHYEDFIILCDFNESKHYAKIHPFSVSKAVEI